MTSGDPRKQQPDSSDVTKVFPPKLHAVMTSVGCTVVPFEGFPGRKALDLTCWSGDTEVHMIFPPDVAETVIEEIRQAKMKADTGLEAVPANALHSLNGNGAKA